MAAAQPNLIEVIKATLSPVKDTRKQAEDFLKNAQGTPEHLLRVLEVVALNTGVEPGIRQAAAVHFKNSVKKGWDLNREEGNEGVVISESDRAAIKTNMIKLMCTTPNQIQSQLSEAISLIADVDYPEKWKNLMPELVGQLPSQDFDVVNGMLKTASGIFRSFRHVRRSDELYRIIEYTLEQIQVPLLQLFQATGRMVDASSANAAQLSKLMENLQIMCSIFYSLNYQDMPEFFEDNIEPWMKEFQKYLTYQNPILVDADEEEEASALDKLQVAIIKNLNLYADKDEEAFLPFLADFTKHVWVLLMSMTNFPKHDTLATTSMQFLADLIKKPMHQDLFKAEATLREIIVKIVIPNLLFRESDQERFEDDPSEYMITEVEGNDRESRRMCSQDFLKSMCRQFESQTTTICSEHIATMIQEYTQNPSEKWVSKDAAIHLMMGIAIRRSTTQHGVSETNPGVNVLDFFQNQILADLQDKNHTSLPVLKATAIKYVSVFRNQFTREHMVQLLPIVSEHLASPVVVVHTFAAHAIELVLKCKDENNVKKINRSDLQPLLQPLFGSLFGIVEKDENAYAMKCIMRCLAAAQEDVVPATADVISRLTKVLERVARNPINPQFNHFLFESIAVLIKTVCKQDPQNSTSFEQLLFPPFNVILQMEIAEFSPYVFQILAQLLEFRPQNMGLGEAYTALAGALTTAVLWENKGNVPPLSRLLQAYLMQAGTELSDRMDPILGIFQKLNATVATEVHGFEILTTCTLYFPQEEVHKKLAVAFQILVTRLQTNQKPKYVGLLSRYCSVYMHKFGAQSMFNIFESMQSGLLLQLLDNIWPRASGPSTRMEARAQAIGLTKLLCEIPALLANDDGKRIWAKTFVSAVNLLTSEALTRTVGDRDDPDIEIGYDSALFSQLSFAKRFVVDPFSDIADPVVYFATSLQALSATHPGIITPLLQAILKEADPKVGTGFNSIVEATNVTFV